MTKFHIGDHIDSALCTTISHEYYLCTESFNRFRHYAQANISGIRTKAIKIKTHDAYASFLHHLYEFFYACLCRDFQDTDYGKFKKKGDENLIEMHINAEVDRILRSWVSDIKRGVAPVWANDLSYYQIEVDKDFGKMFRLIRNRTAHSLIFRANPTKGISLLEFYNKYHKFAYLLYQSSLYFWTVRDIEDTDWGSIEAFDLSVSNSSD